VADLKRKTCQRHGLSARRRVLAGQLIYE